MRRKLSELTGNKKNFSESGGSLWNLYSENEIAESEVSAEMFFGNTTIAKYEEKKRAIETEDREITRSVNVWQRTRLRKEIEPSHYCAEECNSKGFIVSIPTPNIYPPPKLFGCTYHGTVHRCGIGACSTSTKYGVMRCTYTNFRVESVSSDTFYDLNSTGIDMGISTNPDYDSDGDEMGDYADPLEFEHKSDNDDERSNNSEKGSEDSTEHSKGRRRNGKRSRIFECEDEDDNPWMPTMIKGEGLVRVRENRFARTADIVALDRAIERIKAHENAPGVGMMEADARAVIDARVHASESVSNNVLRDKDSRRKNSGSHVFKTHPWMYNVIRRVVTRLIIDPEPRRAAWREAWQDAYARAKLAIRARISNSIEIINGKQVVRPPCMGDIRADGFAAIEHVSRFGNDPDNPPQDITPPKAEASQWISEFSGEMERFYLFCRNNNMIKRTDRRLLAGLTAFIVMKLSEPRGMVLIGGHVLWKSNALLRRWGVSSEWLKVFIHFDIPEEGLNDISYKTGASAFETVVELCTENNQVEALISAVIGNSNALDIARVAEKAESRDGEE